MDNLTPIPFEDFSVKYEENLELTHSTNAEQEIITPIDYLIIDDDLTQFYPKEKPFERVIGWVKL